MPQPVNDAVDTAAGNICWKVYNKHVVTIRHETCTSDLLSYYTCNLSAMQVLF